MEDGDAIKGKIQEHLVSTGNYEIISKRLKLGLYESGWFDQVAQEANKELQKQADSENSVNFEHLYSVLKPKAELLVPSNVKDDVTEKIKEYLDGAIQ